MTSRGCGSDLLPPTYQGGPTITTDNCEREPIHVPGSVQPHGALLTVDALSLDILQVSANAEDHLGTAAALLRGRSLGSLLTADELQTLTTALPPGSPDHLQFRATRESPAPEPSQGLQALTVHRTGDLYILEFEPAPEVERTGSHALRNAVFALENAPTLDDLLRVAAQVVRDLSGFDRVMVYEFAEDASGEVRAEARRDDLNSFLGHRFPESDIPAQARALYLRHLLRLTADSHADPVPLEPILDPRSGQPTPLGGAVLRSTSPMHLQYLRNMGVASSLSVSIVVDGRLWGLIACHHERAFVVPPETRTALEYLGRLLALQVQVKTRADTDAFRAGLQTRRAHILGAAAHSVDPLATFADQRLDLAGLMRASGVIVFFEGRWQATGLVPGPSQIEALLSWLRRQAGTLVQVEALGEVWPEAQSFADRASGLLAISVGLDWSEGVIWLRPAMTTTVAWGGAPPEQAKDALGPRRSFETYEQTVRGHAEPWHAGEIEEAQELQRALTAALGERLSVVRSLNEALERSNAEWRQYGFVIAHDMQEPLRLITQFAELFQLRYRDQVDENAAQMIRFMLDETARLRSLTGDLHTYTALLSAPAVARRRFSLTAVVQDVLVKVSAQISSSGARVEVDGDLPTVEADPGAVRELLLQLVKNAVTFGGQYAPWIKIGAERSPTGWSITVQDNGLGIAPEYHEKVFGLFQRLGRREDTPGNGIGLALARKIAERHGGALRVNSVPGEGSTFTFWLPDPQISKGARREAGHDF
ncbi:ATP-binding protein [Deinococcus deserti]|uniref:histidine kinase n=1 Tax=Deinococcus deserti (strain DSM 17065 / CIP 109153 / LMG 22923 / VCD115) TaxID=546414 RepID=C1D2Z0_DEIDV|nr:ATP-binding protein [Deinococcus deserti]ACO47779.1 putative histidine kinase, classic, bacteriophytochrome [Deinococcus deserti VCD115]